MRNGGRKFKGMRCDVPEDNRPNLAPISVKNLPPTSSSFPFCFVSSNCSCHHPDPAVIGLFRTKVHGEFPPEIRIPVLCQYTIRIIFYDGETFVLLCRVLFSTADGSCDIYKCCVDIAVLSPSVIISEKLHLPHIGISHPVGFAHRHPNGLCKGQHVLRPINSTMDFPELVYDGFCKDRRQMSLCVITLLFWDLKRLK